MADFRPETKAAIAGVRAALALAAQGTGDVHAKTGRDVVTDADVAVEDQIQRSKSDSFAWPVIGEERGGQILDGVPFWVIDPICGTRSFASGIPLFSVNVALIEDGRVAASIVADGSRGDILVAETGKGGWRVGEHGSAALTTSDSSLIVDFGAWPRQGPERSQAANSVARAITLDRWDVRCFSTTLSLAQVATGQLAGCVLFASSDLVHIAAGTLLVDEAGGQVTDSVGEPWTIAAKSLVCAANERFHLEVLELLRTARHWH
jgi:myo-inositol-1(or 4)-monophosphatase